MKIKTKIKVMESLKKIVWQIMVLDIHVRNKIQSSILKIIATAYIKETVNILYFACLQ